MNPFIEKEKFKREGDRGEKRELRKNANKLAKHHIQNSNTKLNIPRVVQYCDLIRI